MHVTNSRKDTLGTKSNLLQISKYKCHGLFSLSPKKNTEVEHDKGKSSRLIKCYVFW